MFRQTIRTFYEVKDGIVEVAHTDPVLAPPTMRDKEKEGGDKDAEDCIERRAEKKI